MTPDTKPRSSIAFWLYSTAFVLNAIGFLVNEYQNDTHGMVFHGFVGMYWYACASKERAAK